MKIFVFLLLIPSALMAANVPIQPVSGTGSFTVTPGTGSFPSSQSGAWSVSPGTGTYPAGQQGAWSVSPGTGTYGVSQQSNWGVQTATITKIAADATSAHSPVFVEIAGNNTGVFGDLMTAEVTPVIQIDFVYGIHPQLGSSTIVNAGVVDSSSSRLRLQSGTNSAGSATFMSVNPARYRPGQGNTARFTALWTGSAADSKQIVGMGDNGDGYFFGYNGTSFGILHKNKSVETWIPQAQWNHDTADGNGISGINWDKTKGNVMMIQYPFLGFGDIKFFVEGQEHGRFTLVHVIEYANQNTEVEVSNPSLKFKAQVVNSGNTTNLTMYVGSVGVFVNGPRVYLGPQFGVSNIKTTITTEQSIFAIRNATTYNGTINTGLIRLRSLSFANDNATAIGTMRIIKGATIGGAPAFTPISGTTANNGLTITSGASSVSYDVAGTTGTGGYTVFNTLTSRNTSEEMDLTPYNIYLAPGEDAIFAAQCSAATSFGIAVNWNEDN